MTTLIAGIVIFFGVHIFTSTGLRDKLVGLIGKWPYKIIFALIALAGFNIMIWGMGISRYGPDSARIVFNPPEWSLSVTGAFTLVGMIVLGSLYGKSHIRKFVKQPMTVGIGLWAFGHLFSNGNLNEVLLFGSFVAYAIYDYVVCGIKGKTPDYQPKISGDIIAIVIGVAITAAVLFFHFNLFGVAVV